MPVPSSCPIALMAAPAAKTRSPPYRTTARTSSRVPASSAAARTSRRNCSLIAFIFGRSRRIVPTPSSTCRVTNSGSVMPRTVSPRLGGSSGGEAAVGAGEGERQAEGVRQVGRGQDVVGRTRGDHLALAEQQGVRVAGRDLLDVVGDQHLRRREVVVRQVGEPGDEILAAAQIQPRSRLGEQQQLGGGHERTGDLGALALALAEGAVRVVCVLFVVFLLFVL